MTPPAAPHPLPSPTPAPELQQLLAPVPKAPQPLQPTGSWPLAHHHWEEPELRALAAAAFSGRPLLITGEPGVGKSQLARAAAALLGWRFEYEVITPRFEPQDLLWRFDAMRRLADATANRLKAERDYATPGALWRALAPADAGVDPAEVAKPGCVLLIDEIDKADSDLPNSLLEVLGNRGFKTRFDGLEQVVPAPTPDPNADARPPGLLIVITSNNERELPLAFIRRCAVLDLPVPNEQADPTGFKRWLQVRGQAQFGHLAPTVRSQAAEQVRLDRAASPIGQGARPGLAEYLDLLRALDGVTAGQPAKQRTRHQLQWLGRISPFVLRKQPGAFAAPEGVDAPAGEDPAPDLS